MTTPAPEPAAPQGSPTDMIQVVHESHAGKNVVPGVVSRDWFDTYGQAKGWVEYQPDQPTAQPATVQPAAPARTAPAPAPGGERA